MLGRRRFSATTETFGLLGNLIGVALQRSTIEPPSDLAAVRCTRTMGYYKASLARSIEWQT
jgi:hypothetical protein